MAPLVAMLINTVAPLLIEKVSRRNMTDEEKKEEVKATVIGVAKSKTMWVAFIIGVIGLIEQNQALITHYFGEVNTGTVMLWTGVIMGILRAITHGSLSDKVE